MRRSKAGHPPSRTHERVATAAADPASDSTADTTSAGRYPATTPAEEASEPCAVNTAVTIAIPNAPPNRPKVLFTPEAVPTSAGGTEPSAAEADVGIDIEMPTPAMISGATNCAYPPAAEATAATQTSPAACSASPVTSIGLVPIRSASAPA